MPEIRAVAAFGLVLAAAAGLALTQTDGATSSLTGLAPARMLLSGAIGFILLGSLLWRPEARPKELLAEFLFFSSLLLLLFAGYSYRYQLAEFADQVVSELAPGAVVEGKGGEVIVTRRFDGNFYLRMNANGVTLPFVFDTGASSVVIRAEDAGRIGIAMNALAFTVPILTANGRALAAEAEIARLGVGGIVLRRVPALVTRAGALKENLLGMSFLEKLASFTVSGDKLVLKGP